MIRCATSNPGKLAEFQLAAPAGWCVLPAGQFNCPESGRTFEENAVQKALCYARHVRGLVFTDDSGLEVDALDGAPGIHSARYAGPGATDEQNRALLLENLRRVSAHRPKARFVCIIALALPEQVLGTFPGVAEGEIAEAPLGAGGFGYDPLFYFPPLGRTFAQLSEQEKLLHSHRGKAFRAMVRWIEQQGGSLDKLPPES